MFLICFDLYAKYDMAYPLNINESFIIFLSILDSRALWFSFSTVPLTETEILNLLSNNN